MKRRTLIYIIVLIGVLALVIAGMLVTLYSDFTPRHAEETAVQAVDTSKTVEPALPHETAEEKQEQPEPERAEADKAETETRKELPAPEVEIPKGPWEVRNAATGKICLFGQKEDMSIYLMQDGKALWTQPFKGGNLCGNAVAVDYYGNGKLQYAFAAGSKIYLYDRLGRPVKGFPTELGKEILLGPAVYDFNGVKRYNILVLHKDNSIQMYNFKGVKPDKWKGIAPESVILSLPELMTEGNDSYWLVRTASGDEKWPFYGGEKLK